MADLFSGVDDGATQMPTLPYAACHSAAPPLPCLLLHAGGHRPLPAGLFLRALWYAGAGCGTVHGDGVAADDGDAGHVGETRGPDRAGDGGAGTLSRGRRAARRRALAAALARPGLFGCVDTGPAQRGRLSFVDFNGGYQPPTPTDALPGTIEKLLVMRERAALRQQLHHPLDARRSLP